jgi:YebC/PmpR family DNA-binding regulatory protein
MAGHSKWANIKHRKGANDAKKAKYFGKLIREITAAVKQSGNDIEANPRLRLAIQNAKGANMPKENIERAINKGSTADTADFTSVVYEGNASHGVALIVECTTDNLNRTVANVRAAFSKYGGSLGKNGSVSFLFNRKGTFSINAADVKNEEALTLALIEAGAESIDHDEEEGYYHIISSLEDFGSVQKGLDHLHLEPISASLQYIPQNHVVLNEDALAKVLKLIEALEDNDDVQRVYHNIADIEQ